MSNHRKTVNVESVLDKTNAFLRLSPPEATQARLAVAGLLESVLHETGNYEGFRYTASTFDERGVFQGNEPTRFERGVTDETRRQYYRSRKLA